jgi:hypothetical protein
LIWVSKNGEFDAEIESVEKVAKKLTQRKLQGLELLYTVPKGEKVHNSYTFKLITFFIDIFSSIFSMDSKSALNSAFFDTHIKII